MHRLRQIESKINETHPGLGRLVAFSLIAVKAKKCLLAVSPAGCGKSVSTQVLSDTQKASIKLDSVTRSGLVAMSDKLSGSQSLITVDDLGKIDTDYSRMATMTTFCELCYSHYVSKHTIQVHVDIDNFQGSAVLNCQPVILRKVVEKPEWEATIQDKTIRYYHMTRPTKPNPKLPDLDISWGIELPEVEVLDYSNGFIRQLFHRFRIQWSATRTLEHLTDMLRATASLDDSKTVRKLDYDVFSYLAKPLLLERYAMKKKDFEEGRSLDSNLLCLITEFVTYKQFTLRNITDDFKVSEKTAYRLMERFPVWWGIVGKNPTIYAPSQEMLKILKEVT